MVNNRLLIVSEAAPRNWLFSEAAGLLWMCSAIKLVSPRSAVLTIPGHSLDEGECLEMT